jgi:hypothetical protein
MQRKAGIKHEIRTRLTLRILFLLVSGFGACKNNPAVKKIPAVRYYYLEYNLPGKRLPDTMYLKSLNREVGSLQNIYTAEFIGTGKPVYKFANDPASRENKMVYYYTEDFGIIYSKSIARKNYNRLHATNDSADRAIGGYIDKILSNQSLVAAGEEYIERGDTIIRLEPENCDPNE